MRSIDPFSYWRDRASQLRGWGGERPSPDPQYCFHTSYEAVRPGRAVYSLKLLGSQATRGELTLRVHAYRPDSHMPPVLTAGGRLELGTDRYDDLAVSIPFHAINGVDYALYGFFTEPTDLSVERIEVLLDEPEGGEDVEIEAPISPLARPISVVEAGPATGLSHHEAVDRARPVSQDCTWRQLDAGDSIPERLEHWREAICLAALMSYEVDGPGLSGWVAGHASRAMREALVAKPVALYFHSEAPTPDTGEFADFVLWPDGPSVDGDAAERWTELHAWLERLKIGGLAVVGLRYRIDDTAPDTLSRNEIKKWAFRAIGLGYSVAPLAFAVRNDLVIDEAGMAACCLIVRRQ